MSITNLWSLAIFTRSLLILFLLVSNVVGEVNDKALKILERTSAYYQEIESFRATYELTIHYPELEESIIESLKVMLTVRGQQYQLDSSQQETITDGQTLWIYDKEMKEVTISNYATTDAVLNFVELYNLYQQGYTVTYLKQKILNKKKNSIQDVVQLIPHSDNTDSNFTSIILSIDAASAQIHSWEITQNEGTKYVGKLCSFEENIELSDDYFTFDLTSHDLLEVIDLREPEYTETPSDSDMEYESNKDE